MAGRRYLILENGARFAGYSLGAAGHVTGEIVFTTGMTGYLETLTDPSYQGQIILQTFPLIGNYGIIPEDFESRSIHASGYIVKHACPNPSNFRNAGDLDTFLIEQGIVGLTGIDTRAVTRIIREQGVMNGCITDDDPESVDLDAIRQYRIQQPVHQVTVRENQFFEAPQSRYTVALIDFGCKENIRRCLLQRGCNVWVFPAGTPAEEILEIAPDGIVLSNGPGDPADNQSVIRELKKLIEVKPVVFGICLGHQLLALACGLQTVKLKYGHRGSNQPVRDCQSGRVFITSQNHGYTVLSTKMSDPITRDWFININDGTCEGLIYERFPGFSVQFHPEGSGGPQDTGYLFDVFVKRMEAFQNATK